MRKVVRITLIGLVGIAALAVSLYALWPRVGASIVLREFEHEDVSFRSADGTTLYGTLVLPSGAAVPKAAVVLVHGSGKQQRMFFQANALASHGLLVFTYDKRGVGRSGGVYAGPEVGTNNVTAENLRLLAADAAAAAGEVTRHLRGMNVPVGLVGFSQGGWIVPLAALENPDVDFMILWSGPVVTVREQLRFQFFTDTREDFWDHHTEAEAREHVRSDPDRYPFVDTDPVDALKRLSIPGLWLFGGRDVNLPTQLSIERLQALIESGKPFEYRLFPQSGHQLNEQDPLPTAMDWLTQSVVDATPRRTPPRQ
jgi:uncharacterized protein